MKNFLNNTWVHWIIVAIFTAGTQLITSNGWDTVTVGTAVHGLYELYLSY